MIMSKYILAFLLCLICSIFVFYTPASALDPTGSDFSYNENTVKYSYATNVNSDFLDFTLHFDTLRDNAILNNYLNQYNVGYDDYKMIVYTSSSLSVFYLSDDNATLQLYNNGNGTFKLQPSSGKIFHVAMTSPTSGGTTYQGWYDNLPYSNMPPIIRSLPWYCYFLDCEFITQTQTFEPIPDFVDEYDFYKNDNLMRMIFQARATTQSRLMGSYYKTANYTFTLTYLDENGNTIDIPCQWYRSYMPKVLGVLKVEEVQENSGVYDWYYKIDRKDVYSQYYFSCLQIYSYSDGANLILVAPGDSGTVPPDLNDFVPLPALYNYHYQGLWQSAELPYISLRQVMNYLTANNYNYTFNDLYKGQFVGTFYYANTNTIAYQNTVDWSEYIDSGIVPPFDTDDYSLIDPYPWVDVPPPTVDPITAPTPTYPVNYPSELSISNYTLPEYTPDSSVLEDIGYFFGIFLSDPHIMIMIYMLMGLYVCYVFLWG